MTHLASQVVKLVWKTLPVQLRVPTRALVDWLLDIGRGDWYSQFGEDAVLQAYFETKAWKATRRTPFFRRTSFPKGLYVDIGAYSPKRHSNTYAFYRRGWRGINVDPTPGTMHGFRLVRPGDVNVELGVSGRTGRMTFFCWDYPCVVNTLSEANASRLAKETGVEPRRITVATVTMEELLDSYLSPGASIDLMSVDVEGYELEVLASNNWSKYRPEVLVVEQHGELFQQVLASPVVRFVSGLGYRIHAWVPPSVILVRDASPSDDRSTNAQV